MAQSDFIGDKQSDQGEQGTTLNSIADIMGTMGTFILWIGLFRTFTPGEFYNGLVTLGFAVAFVLTGIYLPDLKAAYHARDKKYVVMYVFYGARMVRRDIELLEDPLVVARLTDDDKLEFEREIDDTDYEAAIRAVGADFLTDNNVDEKIEEALKQRYKRAKEKVQKKRSGLWRWPYKRPVFIRHGDKEDVE